MTRTFADACHDLARHPVVSGFTPSLLLDSRA